MKKSIVRIGIGAVVFVMGMVAGEGIPYLSTALLLGAYVVLGWDVLWDALRNILRGRVFDENFLMALATVGAIAIGEYPEAVAVMLFYKVGELFEHFAVDKSRRSIADLMNIRPDYANLIRGEVVTKVDPDKVVVGDEILVRPGERVPLDGVILTGLSSLDTSALTGESVPRDVRDGDEILSGCINGAGLLRVRALKPYGESTVSKILDLVENASSKKSQSERFITRFAAIYTPAVVIAAVLLAIVPPLFVPNQTFTEWIYRALNFLVVSCPCALVISVPLSFFGGIGGASRKGILIKGSNHLEALARTSVVVMDKTGTLTRGVFDVQEIDAHGMEKTALLRIAALAESHSSHPISLSLRKAYGQQPDLSCVSQVSEQSGHGISAQVEGKKVLVGNAKLMQAHNIPYTPPALAGTIVYVAIEGVYAGSIRIADQLKDDARTAIAQLKTLGVDRLIMLTGDNQMVATQIAQQLGLDEVCAELLPEHKVEKVEQLLSTKKSKSSLVFVGDGINDAPVLARADVGVAMGGLGSDAAIEAADVVLMTDEPSKLADALRIAKKTLAIVNQNIAFALGIKFLVLILSALGYANMWMAVFADVGVSVIAILNALRALRA